MSAGTFDLLLAGSSGSATGSSQTVNDTTVSKAEKRFADLSRRRATVLSDAKSTAHRWKCLNVGRKVYVDLDPDSEETLAVLLRCLLCQSDFSASNESRIATCHLKNAGYSKVLIKAELILSASAVRSNVCVLILFEL